VGSHKEELWLQCRDKACCWNRTVYPTGADVQRIAKSIFVSPWHFTVALRADGEAPDAFALDHSAKRYRMALAKGGPPQHGGPTPCTFLIRTPDGTERCGLGDLRPATCHSFPCSLVDGKIRLANDMCTCRTWTADDIDVEGEAALLRAQVTAQETYHRIVASWNERVRTSPDPERFELEDFGRYLLDAYAKIEGAA
jgi:Fe-S-cluster containining protein